MWPVRRRTVAEVRRAILARGIAAAAGLALAASFAPYGIYPLALLAPAVLMWLWLDAPTPREAAWLGFWFSAGTFSVGTWWLYISIHGFGQAPVWLALLLLAALVGIMAAYQAGLGYVLARFLPRGPGLGTLVAMPAAWLLVEWWRGWFLSGFPWLSLGYSQTDSVLASFAPVGGVYLISAVLLVGAGALVTLLRGHGRQRLLAAAVLLLPWLLAWGLKPVEWSKVSGPPTDIAILQGAIPQDMKWLEDNRDATLDLYRKLNTQALGARVIIWPESAPPDLANNIASYLGGIWSAAHAMNSDVVMGVVRVDEDGETYYNSILAMADAPSFYDKRHLVPFGEYFPVPTFVRHWLRLMSLPYSDFTPGAANQPPLSAGGLKLAASICYEDAYPSGQLGAMRASTMLVNVTNDAWFGKAGARYQHFQIARMRAIESQRYMLRAANDGVSAIIGERGQVLAKAPEYTATLLRGLAIPRSGATPYLRAGNVPVIASAALALLLLVLPQQLRRRRRAATT
jgi:apolipoprotein N-acyltransferase